MSFNWLSCRPSSDRQRFEAILENIDLSDVNKQLIQSRYITVLESFQKRVKHYSIIFHMGHIIITVGSLFVPALLSIQNSNATASISSGTFAIQVYWATFIVSLLVTIFNGILTLFKIDKKYYFLNTTLERLRTEGWQYFGLTGRYAGQLIGNTHPTHLNQFIYFTHQIERIKMKQVEEEYYKSDEKIENTPNGQGGSQPKIQNELYPPSLGRPIASMVDVPDPVQDAVNSLIRSQNTVEPHMASPNPDTVEPHVASPNPDTVEPHENVTVQNTAPVEAAPKKESTVHRTLQTVHHVIDTVENDTNMAVSAIDTVGAMFGIDTGTVDSYAHTFTENLTTVNNTIQSFEGDVPQ